jgi:DNA-binding response OmpR family regulator
MRVLVVDDEPKIAGTIRQALVEEGYSTDMVHTGEDALEWAVSAPYDLIVLDVLLPGRSGVEVCRSLRQQGIKTPVLLLTALDGVEDRVRGLDSGADDYLPKPFALSELLARLRALTRRGPQLQAPILALADLKLNPITREVERAGRLIDLTNKEFRILEYLFTHVERVISREMIIEHAWDYNFDSDMNVVDVYIRYLRRKIDDDAAVKLIHTVRGVGYRLGLPRG